MQLESTILYYYWTVVGLIGQILSVLFVISLIRPLKGSTRSIVYALGSAISFFIGGFNVIFVTIYQYPISPATNILLNLLLLSSIEIVIGWHNVLGVICGYILLIIAIIQYRRDCTKQQSMGPTSNESPISLD